ncbi:MAG TPA: nucleoside-diphosphate kinase [Patescibacteria group bacterium]|nr:nucleoside-diphosphate kinase [Patescibacteria group bacterium]
MEQTLVLLKPDAVRRGLCGEIISRIERKGLTIVKLKMLTLSREMAEKHYAEHIGKDFFPDLVNFIISGPLIAMAVEGPQAIVAMRTLMGSTNPVGAVPGTIRGDMAVEMRCNLVHGSDSAASAARELNIFFG